jgi:hypothetical protein
MGTDFAHNPIQILKHEDTSSNFLTVYGYLYGLVAPLPDLQLLVDGRLTVIPPGSQRLTIRVPTRSRSILPEFSQAPFFLYIIAIGNERRV